MANPSAGTDKWKALEERLQRLGIFPADLDETFVRSGGHGGQNVNKVSTCVVLVHRPSGISVRCQEERTQGMNRYRARKRLADKTEERKLGAASKQRQAIEKIRRQKRKRSKRAKEKMLDNKHHTAAIKATRSPVRRDDD